MNLPPSVGHDARPDGQPGGCRAAQVAHHPPLQQSGEGTGLPSPEQSTVPPRCRKVLLPTQTPRHTAEHFCSHGTRELCRIQNCPVSQSQKKNPIYRKCINDLLKLSLIYKQHDYNFGLLIWISSKTNSTRDMFLSVRENLLLVFKIMQSQMGRLGSVLSLLTHERIRWRVLQNKLILIQIIRNKMWNWADGLLFLVEKRAWTCRFAPLTSLWISHSKHWL